MSTTTLRRLFHALTPAAMLVLPSALIHAQTTLPIPAPFVGGGPTGVTMPGRLWPGVPIALMSSRDVPFHPVIDEEPVTDPEYEMLQALTAQDRVPRHSDGGGTILPQSSSFYVTAGMNQGDADKNPPDCTLAVGPSSAVEVANGAIRIYSRASGGIQTDTTVDARSFMNWTHSGPVDCRALYDTIGGHFFVSFGSGAYKDAAGVLHQDFLLAVSQTKDAFGAWWTYSLDTIPIMASNPKFISGDTPLFDFPDIGLDANNLYVTGNVFGSLAYYGATVIVLDKNALEAGKTLYGFHTDGLNSTLTPPYVRSNSSGYSYLIFPQEFSTAIGVYAWSGAVSSSKVALTGPYNITVPYYSPPPGAVQPGALILDTLDGRFQDKTTQLGDTVYAVHTVDDNGYPDVCAYQLDALHKTLVQSTKIYTSATSSDFNPSIAANDLGAAVVNWNVTDGNRRLSVFECLRAVFLTNTKPWPAHTSGVAVPGATSSVALMTFRNGDYSMTVVDPTSEIDFWGVNQTALDAFDWNTFIFSYRTP